MKCGILTINVDIMNYGNRLQNYALQKVLEKFGFEVETVNYKPKYEESSLESTRSSLIDIVDEREKMFQRKCLIFRRIFFLRNRFMAKKKRDKFNQFINSKIKWTRSTYHIDSNLKPLSDEFDFMVCGSDQVWNPYWEGTNPIYFMGFMPEQRRIAYAASFGVSNIPEEKRALFRESIMSIPYVSCREKRGVEIIEELTHRKVPQVLDPVFMLSKEEWAKIEKKPVIIPKDSQYILAYFLGGFTHEFEEQIHSYEKEYGLPIVYLDKKDKVKSIFGSPEEFIYLIGHASLVCTDSFHGTAFSILFNIPFVCFQRTLDNGAEQNMNSRFSSLFQLFKCGTRYANEINGNVIEMQFNEINDILAEKRRESEQYLKEALYISK